MWITAETIVKIQPAYTQIVLGNIDYKTIDNYTSTQVVSSNASLLYLYKINFIPKYESNFFVNVNTNVRINTITNADASVTYEDASIETLSNTKQYITPLNFYQKNNFDTVYLFTPVVEDIYVNVEYELSNISTLKDLYPFIANNSALKSIQIKTSPESAYQFVTKDFLLNFKITYATSVKIVLHYKLIDSNHTVTTVFNNNLNIKRKSVNVYTHSLENWQDIDIITNEVNQDYYRNELFSTLSNPGFIINSNYIYQVL